MLRKERPGTAASGQRSAPSIASTVQALRAISGRAARTKPEARIIAMRRGGQLI
jgi:hypothetical protein